MSITKKATHAYNTIKYGVYDLLGIKTKPHTVDLDRIFTALRNNKDYVDNSWVFDDEFEGIRRMLRYVKGKKLQTFKICLCTGNPTKVALFLNALKENPVLKHLVDQKVLEVLTSIELPDTDEPYEVPMFNAEHKLKENEEFIKEFVKNSKTHPPTAYYLADDTALEIDDLKDLSPGVKLKRYPEVVEENLALLTEEARESAIKVLNDDSLGGIQKTAKLLRIVVSDFSVNKLGYIPEGHLHCGTAMYRPYNNDRLVSLYRQPVFVTNSTIVKDIPFHSPKYMEESTINSSIYTPNGIPLGYVGKGYEGFQGSTAFDISLTRLILTIIETDGYFGD